MFGFLVEGLCQRSAPILETSRSRLDMTVFRAKNNLLRVSLALTYYSDILAFFLTFFPAFFLACFVAFGLAFSPACVRVQAWSAALGAGDMVFGSRKQGAKEGVKEWEGVAPF